MIKNGTNYIHINWCRISSIDSMYTHHQFTNGLKSSCFLFTPWDPCATGAHPRTSMGWRFFSNQKFMAARDGYLEDHPRTCKWLGSPPFVRPCGRGPTSPVTERKLTTNSLLFGMILQVGRRDIQMAPRHEFLDLDVCVPNEVCESPMPGLTWSSCALGGISQSTTKS